MAQSSKHAKSVSKMSDQQLLVVSKGGTLLYAAAQYELQKREESRKK